MKQFIHGQTLIQHFESWSPQSIAVEGDKNGLMIGTLNKRIKKVMVALDVLEEVIDEAVEQQVDLIIAHHPLIFSPLKKIDTNTAMGRIVSKAIKHDIAVYAAHTNLDIAVGGVNDMLAEALKLENTKVLAPTSSVALKKLVVFVPVEQAQSVREAMARAGAGHIGAYSECAFVSNGQGTFKPGEGTNPHIGTLHQLEIVDEVKIETIVQEHLLKKVIAAMIKAHPYEEPAYDVIPLENSGEVLGLGRIGRLHEPMTLRDFTNVVKQALDVERLRVVGPLDSHVQKVAVLGGDGNKYMQAAIRQGADVIVTGDVYYHVAHDAMMDGLHIVDPGHNVEKIMKRGVAQFLQQFINEQHVETEVIISHIHTDPFTFV